MFILSAIKRVPEEIQTRLEEKFNDVQFMFCHGIEEAEQHLPKADVFITYGEDLTPERIESAEGLKWIMVLSAGVDRMPFDEIEKRGILVTNVRGIHAAPMAEYAISMLLQVYRQAKALTFQEKDHQWSRRPVMNEISGRTMVLLGTGAIAQGVARLAKAFQMKTIGISKTGSSKPHFDETYSVEQMKEMLAEADFVVAVLPSTPDTQYLLKADHFKTMPDHTVFLNMGRGDLVATDVIMKAVNDAQIAHAVLDVFETEPLPENHPLWETEKITITPHISGVSPHYIPRGFELFEENLQAFISGRAELTNKIDPKRGY